MCIALPRGLQMCSCCVSSCVGPLRSLCVGCCGRLFDELGWAHACVIVVGHSGSIRNMWPNVLQRIDPTHHQQTSAVISQMFKQSMETTLHFLLRLHCPIALLPALYDAPMGGNTSWAICIDIVHCALRALFQLGPWRVQCVVPWVR